MVVSLSFAVSSLATLHTRKPITPTFISSATFLNVGRSSCCSLDSPKRKKSVMILCTRGNNNNSVPAADRLIAAVGYFLPFFDGVQYGRFFLNEFPPVELLLQPLFPAIRAYRSFPFSSFLVFFLFYFSVVRNPNLSRYVRFNVMQAIVLDVILIFPDLVDRSVGTGEGIGLNLLISFDNTVFLFLITCLVYGSSSCLLGQLPRLPLVADAADSQISLLGRLARVGFQTLLRDQNLRGVAKLDNIQVRKKGNFSHKQDPGILVKNLFYLFLVSSLKSILAIIKRRYVVFSGIATTGCLPILLQLYTVVTLYFQALPLQDAAQS